MPGRTIFDTLESEVRTYSRSFPCIVDRALGVELIDVSGRRYLDFLAGAGSLNYGHNNPVFRRALIDYIERDGIALSLDLHTVAKQRFLETFQEIILKPRGLDYVVQFTGPTGTNAVEAAMKLARKVTGRENVIGFTNAFHGMTLGSLGVTGNSMKRGGAGIGLAGSTSMPYDGYMGDDTDTIELLESMLGDDGSGLEDPAAIIVETIQAEGGINTASFEWLRRLQEVCRRHEALLIVDDIQVGCGRTGPFFSFEEAGIDPDIITLSKSLSGYGLPFAITLMKPERDVWEPGEHNGTFRGFTPAMATATATLNEYWTDDELTSEVARKALRVEDSLEHLARSHADLDAARRGRGLIQGLACRPGVAEKVARVAFENGLLVETSGAASEVVKLLPPLTISDEALSDGLELLEDAIDVVAEDAAPSLTRAGAAE